MTHTIRDNICCNFGGGRNTYWNGIMVGLEKLRNYKFGGRDLMQRAQCADTTDTEIYFCARIQNVPWRWGEA